MPRAHWILTCVHQLCGPAAAAKYAQLPLNGQTFEHRLLLLAQRGESHPIVIQLLDASVAGRIENPKMCISELASSAIFDPHIRTMPGYNKLMGGER